ncbi:MAG: hypothetical protein GF353_08855 [Candidatus Lokiarchaeota archaeon]|nr:hypothetical protein [Candidatus Lokiarchaeota archaeon]
MIFQGIFTIFDLYFEDLDLFYLSVDDFFKEKISELRSKNSKEPILKNKIHLSVIAQLSKIGFDEGEIEHMFVNSSINKRSSKITELENYYDKNLSPLIHEIYLEKMVDYLADMDVRSVILNSKSKNILPLEFIVEIKNLKEKYEKNRGKLANLKKYINIKKKITEKFCENKKNIESLEDLQATREKLQLLYFIFRIIDFFHLRNRFDFSHIEIYLKNHMDDWLRKIPLVSLKNPELYFCGLFLASNLNIKLDFARIQKFLGKVYKELKDEFESPIIQATSQLYYYIKSINLLEMDLSRDKIEEMISLKDQFFQAHRLKDLETSTLVVIQKILKIIGISTKVEEDKLKAIHDEIKKRISKKRVTLFREGIISSEATYYIIFYHYMRDELDELEEYVLLENIVTRVHRNLDILYFSKETNYDLFSEIFYSCESLKLFNNINSKLMIIKLARFLFPTDIEEEIKQTELKIEKGEHFRHFHIDKTTGETIHSH